ncbi:Undecaprenyl phosphate-alpha-4-amino-4-deoxy-L-arabinose arabinosyl transferase [Planctomycetes bacterium Pan216]|uniref:Undecaprenyl phosphate-alpha-4-amino-4-deoxy-L-arabinose arabinosyl transferase n=1 Tax=Kolteria novifilia TaxID=2527975 RepID=A0A518BCD9_9BACT|nr:Undecaprenyl phosphate-alpha-4-amino-4-deoxy-L-arabinose arabinosyl transferase [Planctomycetes bacterium Pan216]
MDAALETPLTTESSERANRPQSARRRWHPSWLVLHASFLALVALAWVLDGSVFHLANNWFNGPEPLNGELHQLIISMAMYGQALGIVMSLVMILVFDQRHRGRALVLGVMLILTGLSCGMLKMIIGRQRPLQAVGQTVLEGPARGFRSSRNQSFPSGHTATAFAMSYGLSAFYPPARPIVWALAYGCAFNRIITVRHFASDVVAGAWLGLIMGCLVLKMPWLRRWEETISRAWSDGLTRPWSIVTGLVTKKRVWRLISSPGVLVIVTLAVAWAGNAETPLWDRDEPRFATAAREMLERGDWVVPTFNGHLRPDKPILIYWLMMGAIKVFGDGTFAVRFFSGCGLAGAALLVYFLGRSMFDRRVGVLAGWMLALSPMAIVEAKLATVDSVLLFFIMLALTALWRLYQGPSLLAAFAFWAALGLGVLTKGPVALGVVGLTLVPFCLLRREFRWLGRLHLLMGPILFVAIIAPWVMMVQQRTDGDFLHFALGHHVVRRSFKVLEGHRGFPGFYVLTLLGLMFPWAILLPWSIKRHWQQFRVDPRLAFLACWTVGPLLMFELVKTKLVHYYLPAYPALALIVASALVGRFAGRTGLSAFPARLGHLLVAGGIGGSIAGLGFAIFLSRVADMPETMIQGVVVISFLAFGGLVPAGYLISQRRLKRGFVIVAGTMVAAFIVGGSQLAPNVGKGGEAWAIAQRLRAIETDRPIALWLYREPSIIHQVGHPIPLVDPMRSEPIFPQALRFALDRGPFVTVMTDEDIERMSSDPTLELTTVESITRFSFKKFRDRSVHLVEVRPSARAEEIVALHRSRDGAESLRSEIDLSLDWEWEDDDPNAGRRYPLNPVCLPFAGPRYR